MKTIKILCLVLAAGFLVQCEGYNTTLGIDSYNPYFYRPYPYIYNGGYYGGYSGYRVNNSYDNGYRYRYNNYSNHCPPSNHGHSHGNSHHSHKK